MKQKIEKVSRPIRPTAPPATPPKKESGNSWGFTPEQIEMLAHQEGAFDGVSQSD